MREYQQKKLKEYVLPEAVYRQALWAVKDLPRLRRAYMELEAQTDCRVAGDVVEYVQSSNEYLDRTGSKGSTMADISNRIYQIESALKAIPEYYRKGLKCKFEDCRNLDDTCNSEMWKKWQQIFIFNVAKNLNLY